MGNPTFNITYRFHNNQNFPYTLKNSCLQKNETPYN